MSIAPKQFAVVEGGEVDESQIVGRIVLVDADGEPWSPEDGGGPVSWTSVTGKPADYPPADHAHAWGEVTGKPSTFAPADHTHAVAVADVDGLQAALDDITARLDALETPEA